MECKKCGSLIQDENANFCPECGTEIPRKTGISEGLRNLNAGPEKEAWPKRIAITLFFWGIINLIFTSPFGGGILIFFAVLIFASRSSLAIYAFGVIWLLVAFFQLIYGVSYYQATYSSSQDTPYTKPG
jgi:uncharacterized membrane protein YvbJ